MKKALVVLLIVLMILIGLPLPVMGAMGCADCALMAPTGICVMAFVLVGAAALLVALVAGRRLSAWPSRMAGLLGGDMLFRPPRLT